MKTKKMNSKVAFIFTLLLITFSIFSCSIDDDAILYQETDTNRNDAFRNIIVNTPEVSFLAGEPDYDIEFLIITPNNDEVKHVNIYATFTLPGENSPTSNEVLFDTYPIDQGANTTLIKDRITYEQLRSGILLDGSPLAIEQYDVPVASNWNLRLSPVDGSGKEVFSGNEINIKVLSPFAGLYMVKESYFYRHTPTSDPNQSVEWNGEIRFIGAIDDKTYSHPDYFGPYAGEGQFEFIINEDKSITIPDNPEQHDWFFGTYFLSCQEDGPIFINVPCEGSNVLEPSPDGKHIIKLTYGYLVDNPGEDDKGIREFYEVLEKIN